MSNATQYERYATHPFVYSALHVMFTFDEFDTQMNKKFLWLQISALKMNDFS